MLTFAERLYSRLCAAEGCGRGIGHLGADVTYCDSHEVLTHVPVGPGTCAVLGCVRDATLGSLHCSPCASEAVRRAARAGQTLDRVKAAPRTPPPPARAAKPPAPPKPIRPALAPTPAEQGRRCSRCDTPYPPDLVETAFDVQRGRADASTLRKRICRPCENTGRDKTKATDRWPDKAYGTITRHAKSLGISKDDLIQVHGWDPHQLAHDAEFQYRNGCSYCFKQYKTMGHGTADITLDVIDRSKPPSYRTNTKWCCMTCNSAKGVMAPEQWERYLRMYTLWSAHRSQPTELRADTPAITPTAALGQAPIARSGAMKAVAGPQQLGLFG